MNILLTLLLAGLTMVGPLAIDTYLPSFPAIAQTFDASPLLIQQTLSMFLFCFAFMMLFYGTLSDSFGRRPVILVSLVLYIAASIGAAMAPSIGVLLACRIVQGLRRAPARWWAARSYRTASPAPPRRRSCRTS
jgi:DHA1 family bicyclomycin/chloramphenicol resistance-like MFS transporter